MGALSGDESYEAGALRELKEETGLIAEKLEFLYTKSTLPIQLQTKSERSMWLPV